MSKSLRSMSAEARLEAIRRRLANRTMGIGYWAAVDAAKKVGIPVSKSELK